MGGGFVDALPAVLSGRAGGAARLDDSLQFCQKLRERFGRYRVQRAGVFAVACGDELFLCAARIADCGRGGFELPALEFGAAGDLRSGRGGGGVCAGRCG